MMGSVPALPRRATACDPPSATMKLRNRDADRPATPRAWEVLLCLGPALWERLSNAELCACWILLRDEISAGIEGEIDEQALEGKRSLFERRSHARGAAQLTCYGCASFTGMSAEYVRCLWHEITVRTGPDYLPTQPLRRRLELMARWFPPDHGHRLFPTAPRPPGGCLGWDF
jgi:hypothetical protein